MECEFRGGDRPLANCTELSCEYSDSGQRESNSNGGNYGGSSGNGGGGGSRSGVAIAGLSGAAYTIASQEVEAQVLSECYIAPNGSACTKAEVIAAAGTLSEIFVGALQDEMPEQFILTGIAKHFFKEAPLNLHCAFAKKAAVEKCQQAAQVIQQEITSRKQAVAAPKQLSTVLLSSATTIHGGIYDLPQAEREGLVRQFGGERWLVRAIELASKRCASNGRMHAFCYAHSHDRPDQIAKFDAMSQAELNAWENGVLDLIGLERARGTFG